VAEKLAQNQSDRDVDSWYQDLWRRFVRDLVSAEEAGGSNPVGYLGIHPIVTLKMTCSGSVTSDHSSKRTVFEVFSTPTISLKTQLPRAWRALRRLLQLKNGATCVIYLSEPYKTLETLPNRTA